MSGAVSVCVEGIRKLSHSLYVGTFTLSNLGMFGVDRFDAILPPGQVSGLSMSRLHHFMNYYPFLTSKILSWDYVQGAIMAVGASKPTVVAGGDGFFSVKSKMQVSSFPCCIYTTSIDNKILKGDCGSHACICTCNGFKCLIRVFNI